MRFKLFNKINVKKCKIRRRLVAGALVISMAMTLSGCFVKSPRRTNTSSSTPTVSDNYIAPSVYDPAISMQEDDYVVTDIDNTDVSMNAAILTEFNSYIDALVTEYPYSDLYGIDAALDAESKFQESHQHTHDIRDTSGNLSVDKFVESVLANNKVYYENLGSNRSFYQEMSTDEIRKICGILIDNVNTVSRTQKVDLDMVSCKLGNLKMFYKNNLMNASISTDDVLSVDPNTLKVAQVIAGDQDAKTNTLKHEGMHLIQDACGDYTDEFKTGVSYKNKKLPINPLYWSWYIEAAAEKTRVNVTGDPAIVYEYQIGYMESVALALTLRPGYSVNELETLTLTKDQQRFFELFNIPKNEVIKMMYSIEIIEAEPEEFKNVYKEKYGEELTPEKLLEIKRQIKNSICESLSKMFYKNLAYRVSEREVTLEDAFYLIKIFEADLFSHLRYDMEEKAVIAKPFMKRYTDIQNAFFKSLNVENYSFEEIQNYFNNYSMRTIYNGEKRENCSFSWLSESKKDYIQERKAEVYSKNINGIAKTNKLNNEKTLN